MSRIVVDNEPRGGAGEWARAAYGLAEGPLSLAPGGRGAEAVVWRLEVGDEAFALKVPFEACEEAGLAREAALLDHFAAPGVEVPTHRVARDGRYAAWLPAALGGGQVRLTRWVEGTPPGTGTGELARPLGTLLAHLHRAGSGAGPWVVGHRDLHPDNVVVAPDGSLRALDWEDAGPVDRSRELAKVLAQWHTDGDRIDEQAVGATVAAYREGGGTETVQREEDLAMWLCGETNYLARQATLALDPATSADRLRHAATDIELSLTSYLPPLPVLTRLVEVARA
jgi:Ser/Thr protein kinase RdoA (MazF antagonist)